MRRFLAPLEPDAFLRWAWMTGPRERGSSPLTLDDLWFELGSGSVPEYTRENLRRDYVRLAAKVRCNQRLWREPFDGIE